MVNEKMLMGRNDLLEESRKTQKVRIAQRHSKVELAEHIDREKELSGHGEWFDNSEIASLEAWVRKLNEESDDIFHYLQFCQKQLVIMPLKLHFANPTMSSDNGLNSN